ncbi:uncharacterized protein [Diadema antillarum]|uniref:uncharacterized protein n=1 Tax=Diadema antillarum TaxID=105358 RepID=UPI003A8664E8
MEDATKTGGDEETNSGSKSGQAVTTQPKRSSNSQERAGSSNAGSQDNYPIVTRKPAYCNGSCCGKALVTAKAGTGSVKKEINPDASMECVGPIVGCDLSLVKDECALALGCKTQVCAANFVFNILAVTLGLAFNTRCVYTEDEVEVQVMGTGSIHRLGWLYAFWDPNSAFMTRKRRRRKSKRRRQNRRRGQIRGRRQIRGRKHGRGRG